MGRRNSVSKESRELEKMVKEQARVVREWTANVIIEVCFMSGEKQEFPGIRWAPNPVAIEIHGKDDMTNIPYSAMKYFVIHKIPEGDAN